MEIRSALKLKISNYFVRIGNIFPISLLLAVFVLMPVYGATYYVDATNGDDSNFGMSPNDAWQTISKVNSYQLNPGDSILFNRGDYWREQLIPQSGNSEGYILYGAYGVGDKPLFLGSVKKNSQEDWLNAGNNIWSSGEPAVIGSELISNPSFDVNTDGWSLYSEGGAVVSGVRDELEFDTPPASFRIDCISNGSEAHHIQFSTTQGMSITEKKIYKLSFWAKCTQSFEINYIPLMKMTSPWNHYYNNTIDSVSIGTDWTSCVIYYRTNITADDARITFALGGVLPEGESLYIDDISLKECEDADFINDVGNIIFNSEESCGIKVWNSDDLNAQGKFFYNYNNITLNIYSITNPALYYPDIECALTNHIIDESNKSYVIYENLELKYGGAHGIGGGNAHHIIVRDCDISYIGGGELKIEGQNNVRFGNGIEFWANAHDNLVERCRLWEIYDAALTNQNNDMGNVNHYNIIYRNNIIWNCEYSYEFWNYAENGSMYDISFVNNSCAYAGGGWGHSQRPDPSGVHVLDWASVAEEGQIQITNNIFYESTAICLFIPFGYNGLENLNLDYNCWYQTSGDMINFQGNTYTMSQFSIYQSETSQDQNSITEDPLFINLSENDFHLTENSPCIDAGTDVGLIQDFDRNPIIGVPDIGAYEYQSSTYYVDASNGNDSWSGLYDTPQGGPPTDGPWLTIQKASDTVIGGDTVYIKEGIYNEQVIPRNSGSPENYITYTAYPGDIVTIDGAGIPLPKWYGLFDITDKSYIEVSGLRVINSTESGILAWGSNHITIEQNYTYNTISSGIGVWSCSNIVIDGNEVELACNDGDQECITVAITDTFEVMNNHVHHGGPGNNGGEGIDAKDGSSNGIIYKNHVHDMNTQGIYVDAWDKHTYNIDVYQNIVHHCAHGITVASEAGGLLENVSIYNNIAHNNEQVGIWVANWSSAPQQPMKDIKVINNTLYNNGNGWGGGIDVMNSDAENVDIRNNICSQNLSFQIVIDDAPQNLTVDHNLIDGYRGYWGEIYGSDSVVGDPMFVDSAGADFHLQEGSPAIDKGSSVYAPSFDFSENPRPQGTEYDIGAYEYEEMLMGDLNLDGKVDAEDARILAGFLASNIQSFEAELSAADLNGDGGITVVDLVILKSLLY